MLDLDAALAPPTPTAAAALEVLRHASPEHLVGHCLRSWLWASTLGDDLGLAVDRELLYVATMLHDMGVVPDHDAHDVAFERAGGAVARVFAAGAGWPEPRRARVQEIIERHMWPAVDVALDPEGYLLEVATSLDVSGVGPERWDRELLRAGSARLPRGAFSTDFAARIDAQAARKPASAAAGLSASGRVRGGAAVWEDLLA